MIINASFFLKTKVWLETSFKHQVCLCNVLCLIHIKFTLSYGSSVKKNKKQKHVWIPVWKIRLNSAFFLLCLLVCYRYELGTVELVDKTPDLVQTVVLVMQNACRLEGSNIPTCFILWGGSLTVHHCIFPSLLKGGFLLTTHSFQNLRFSCCRVLSPKDLQVSFKKFKPCVFI